MRRLLSGKKLDDGKYELVVEYSIFGLFRWQQAYRGDYAWKRYPQGNDADPVIVQPWLEAQLQQHKWGLT